MLNDIVDRRDLVGTVLICPDEYVFEIISNQHGWLKSRTLVTTYSSIEETDWSVLHGLSPVILPKDTAMMRYCGPQTTIMPQT